MAAEKVGQDINLSEKGLVKESWCSNTGNTLYYENYGPLSFLGSAKNISERLFGDYI